MAYTFGIADVSEFSAPGGDSTGLIISSRVYIGVAGTLESLSFYAAYGSGHCRIALYTDAGELLAESTSIDCSSGWNTATSLSATPELSVGYYRIGVQIDSASISGVVGGSGDLRVFVQTYGSFPSTLGEPAQTASVALGVKGTLVEDEEEPPPTEDQDILQTATSSDNGNGSTISAILSGVSAGSLIHVCVSYSTHDFVPTLACEDDVNGSYELIGSAVDEGNTQGLGHFYFANSVAGDIEVTVTFLDGVTPTATDYRAIFIKEISGCSSEDVLLGHAENWQSNPDASTDAVTSGNVSLPAGNYLISAASGEFSTGANAPNAGTGFSDDPDPVWFGSSRGEHLIAVDAAAQSRAATFTAIAGGNSHVTVMAAFAAASSSPPFESDIFPLTIDATTHRFLRDLSGNPFRIYPEFMWTAMMDMSAADWDSYLTDRQARGFNAIHTQLMAYPGGSWNWPSTNVNGAAPFSTTDDFSTPNPAFWDFVEARIAQANEYGFLVLAFFSYVGYQGVADGWWQVIGNSANTQAVCFAFGQYLGNRLKKYPNVILMAGGDYTMPAGESLTRHHKILEGIRSVGCTALCGFEWGTPDTIAEDQTGFTLGVDPSEADINLNTAYVLTDTMYSILLRCWDASVTLPAWASEIMQVDGGYGVDSSRPSIRKYEHWSSTSGGVGCNFGQVDAANNGAWESHLNDLSVQDHQKAIAFYSALAWEKLVPSGTGATRIGRDLIVSSNPDGSGHITACQASDGTLLLAYVPSTGSGATTFNVDLRSMSGSSRARWWNPTTGTYSDITGGDYTLSNALSAQSFTTPGNNGTGANDWILLLDAFPGEPPVDTGTYSIVNDRTIGGHDWNRCNRIGFVDVISGDSCYFVNRFNDAERAALVVTLDGSSFSEFYPTNDTTNVPICGATQDSFGIVHMVDINGKYYRAHLIRDAGHVIGWNYDVSITMPGIDTYFESAEIRVVHDGNDSEVLFISQVWYDPTYSFRVWNVICSHGLAPMTSADFYSLLGSSNGYTDLPLVAGSNNFGNDAVSRIEQHPINGAIYGFFGSTNNETNDGSPKPYQYVRIDQDGENWDSGTVTLVGDTVSDSGWVLSHTEVMVDRILILLRAPNAGLRFDAIDSTGDYQSNVVAVAPEPAHSGCFHATSLSSIWCAWVEMETGHSEATLKFGYYDGSTWDASVDDSGWGNAVNLPGFSAVPLSSGIVALGYDQYAELYHRSVFLTEPPPTEYISISACIASSLGVLCFAPTTNAAAGPNSIALGRHSIGGSIGSASLISGSEASLVHGLPAPRASALMSAKGSFQSSMGASSLSASEASSEGIGVAAGTARQDASFGVNGRQTAPMAAAVDAFGSAPLQGTGSSKWAMAIGSAAGSSCQGHELLPAAFSARMLVGSAMSSSQLSQANELGSSELSGIARCGGQALSHVAFASNPVTESAITSTQCAPANITASAETSGVSHAYGRTQSVATLEGSSRSVGSAATLDRSIGSIGASTLTRSATVACQSSIGNIAATALDVSSGRIGALAISVAQIGANAAARTALASLSIDLNALDSHAIILSQIANSSLSNGFVGVFFEKRAELLWSIRSNIEVIAFHRSHRGNGMFHIGEDVQLRLKYRNSVNPMEFEITIWKPNGEKITSSSMTKVEDGDFYYLIPIDMAGTWRWRCKTQGPRSSTGTQWFEVDLDPE